jgi:glyoxylase-like metal-dependent hydrolase (beta-lactamase superfamily II)
MADAGGTAHVTTSVATIATELPEWVVLVRAPNPGPMTLDGTNTWVLRAPGRPACVVVDPGPLHAEHLEAVAAHGPVAAVLVTHGHHDHVEGLARFRELTGAELIDVTSVGITVHVAGLAIEVLSTPGHTADSVSFVVSASDGPGGRAVCTGDTILGRGTTVVASPDGDLGDYLDSLGRLAALGPLLTLTGHGPPLTDCAAAATYYLRHRRARLEQVRAAVADGAMTPNEVVAVVYADVDRSLWWAAEWSVQAQLAYLAKEREERSRDRESAATVPELDDP